MVRVDYLSRGGPHIGGVSSQVAHKWMGILPGAPRMGETAGLYDMYVLNNRYYSIVLYSNTIV